MLRELMSLFRSNDAIARMGEDFELMLDLAHDLTEAAGRLFFDVAATPDDRTSISMQDVRLNKLERQIRKQVISHLTLGDGEKDAPYCLLLMSLVKDVERIGDYCKNIAEIYDEGGAPIPDDELGAELREIRLTVDETFETGQEAFATSDSETAMDLLQSGKEITRRCDKLVSRVARSHHEAATTATLILGARYYKRIQAHLLNILSGVVMPLHKLDYYDEDSIPEELED
ncbi:MAG: PhoU domain-containing protein [Longimicrobiales bacterium]